MQLTVVAIGTRMPAWVRDGVAIYHKRLPRHLDLRFRELPPAGRKSGGTPAEAQKQEGRALLGALGEDDYVIALDERGISIDTRRLADELGDWLAHRPRVAFLIGGADGLDDACRRRADAIWSLSALTLPHALVRVVLTEQLYRAWTVLQGHPYHRA